MKRLIATLVILAASTAALAACPPHAPYNCRPGMNGKMICGCGV